LPGLRPVRLPIPLEERAWLAWLEGGGEGLVEQGDEGCGAAEGVAGSREEVGSQGEVGGQGDGDAPLTVEEEIKGGDDGGVVRGEALGGAGEGASVEVGEEGAEFFVGEEAAELGVVSDDVAAEGEELVAVGHEDAGGEDDLGGVELEVEAGAGGLGHAGVRPPGGDVGLVRALVGGEANVAVDAEHGLVRGTDMGGGDVEEVVVEAVDEGEQRGLERALVDGLAGVEPVAGVVLLEAAEELEGFGGEEGFGRHRLILRDQGSGIRDQGLGE
jgi:hypothetical protein